MVTAITATVITPLDVSTGVGTVMGCVTVTFIDICKVQCESGTEKYKMLQNISFRLLEKSNNQHELEVNYLKVVAT